MIRENFSVAVSENEPFDYVRIYNDGIPERLHGYTIAVCRNGSQTCHTPAMTRGELWLTYQTLKDFFED